MFKRVVTSPRPVNFRRFKILEYIGVFTICLICAHVVSAGKTRPHQRYQTTPAAGSIKRPWAAWACVREDDTNVAFAVMNATRLLDPTTTSSEYVNKLPPPLLLPIQWHFSSRRLAINTKGGVLIDPEMGSFKISELYCPKVLRLVNETIEPAVCLSSTYKVDARWIDPRLPVTLHLWYTPFDNIDRTAVRGNPNKDGEIRCGKIPDDMIEFSKSSDSTDHVADTLHNIMATMTTRDHRPKDL